MVVGLGEWASRSVTAATQRFHEDRAETLKVASERAAARLGEIDLADRTLGLGDIMGVQGPSGTFRVGAIPQPGVGPQADQGLGSQAPSDPFDLLEQVMQGLIDEHRPSEGGGRLIDVPTGLEPGREPGLTSLISDIFRQVGRVRGGPASQEAFLPANLGGLAPEIPGIIPEASQRLKIRNELTEQQGFTVLQADYVIDSAINGTPVVEDVFELLGDRPGRLSRVAGKSLGAVADIGGAVADVARLLERIPTPFQPRGRQDQPTLGEVTEKLGPVQTFYERYVNPTQANIAKLTAQAEGLPPPLGSPPVDIPSIGTEIDVTRPSPNIIRAARGDPEEIRKGQDILNDLGLARLPVELLFDPANLLPIIGFTKFPRFTRQVRALLKLSGPAKERALQALRESDLVQDLLRLTRSESGGPLRLQGTLPPRAQIESELVSLQERLTSLDSAIDANFGKKGVVKLRDERAVIDADLARVEAQVTVDDILRRDIEPQEQLVEISNLHADAKDDLVRLSELNAEAEALSDLAKGGREQFAPFGEKQVGETGLTPEGQRVPGTISPKAKAAQAARAADRTALRAEEAAIKAREKVYEDFLTSAEYVPAEPGQVGAGRMDLAEFIDDTGKPSVRLKSGEAVETPTFRGEGVRRETQEGLGLTVPEKVAEGQAALPASTVNPPPPSAVPTTQSAQRAPRPLSPGDRVQTPQGTGFLQTDFFDAPASRQFAIVDLDSGTEIRLPLDEVTPIQAETIPSVPVNATPTATERLAVTPPKRKVADQLRNRYEKAKTDATRKNIESEWLAAHGLEKVPLGSGYGRTTETAITAAPREQIDELLTSLRGEAVTLTAPPTGAVAPTRGAIPQAKLVTPEAPPARARAPEAAPAVERPTPPPPGAEPITAAPSRALPAPTGEGQIAAPPATRALVAPDQVVDDVLQRALDDVIPVTIDDLEAFLREPKPGQILPDGTIAGAAPGELRPKGSMLTPTQRRQVIDGVPRGGGEGPPVGVTASGEVLPNPGPGRLMPPLPSLDELLTDPFFERNTARWVAEHASAVPGVRGGIIAFNPSAVKRYGDLGKLHAAYNRILETANAANQFGMAAIRRLKDAFPVNAEGDVIAKGLSAGPTAPGMAWEDVLERLPRYEGVTDDMVKYRDTIGQVLDEAIAEFEFYGGELNKIGFVEGERWIPRQVIGKSGVEKVTSMLKEGVGAKQGFEKSRMHEYAAQTIAAGNDLNTDKLAVIETTLAAIRRVTVDLQFEAMVKPRGRLPSQLIPKQLKEDVVEALKGVRRARRAVDDERARLRITPRTKEAKPARAAQRAVVEAAKDRLADARARWNVARSARTRAIKGLSFAQEGWKFGRQEPMIAVSRTPPGKLSGLRGRLFATDEIKFLTQVMEDRTSEWLNAFNQVGGLARVAMTAFDPGFWFIQGLVPLGKDLANLARGRPTLVWAKAVKRSMQALADPAVHADYIARQFAENPEMMERFAKHYRGLQWSEYVESARSGGLLYRAGGPIRDVTQRAQVFFDSWMDVAAIEGWKAIEKYTLLDPTKLEQLGGHLRNMTGNLSTAGLGVSRTQRAIEAGFIRFAPRYTRAAFALIFDAMQGGLRGSEARAALGGLAVMGSAAYYGAASALGQDPEFRPWKGGAFLSLKVGEGDEANFIGIGGVFRSLLRFGGDVARSIEENGPDDFVKVNDDNPIVRFLRSGSAPLTGTAWDILDGENFIGEPLRFDDPERFFRRVGSRFLPFWIQGALEANGGVKERLTVSTAEFFGLRTFPASIFGRRDDAISDWATANKQTDADGNPITRYSGTSGDAGVANRAQRKAFNETEQGGSLSSELEERNLEREDVTTKTLNAIDDLRVRVVVDPSTASVFGLTTTQEMDNKALARGDIDGSQWRDRFSDRMKTLRDIRATTEDETLRELMGIDFDIKEPPPGSVDALINDYFDVVPGDFADDIGEIDWDAYFSKKDTAFKTAIRRGGDLVKEYLRPFEEDPVIREFRQAQDLRNELETLPKYQGLSANQAEIMDEFLDEASDLVDIWFRDTGITYPLILAIRAQADFNSERDGGTHESGWAWEFIKGWAILLRQGSSTRDFYTDPARDNFIQDNADPLLTFFPELSRQLSRPQIAGLSERQFETALTQR